MGKKQSPLNVDKEIYICKHLICTWLHVCVYIYIYSISHKQTYKHIINKRHATNHKILLLIKLNAIQLSPPVLFVSLAFKHTLKLKYVLFILLYV